MDFDWDEAGNPIVTAQPAQPAFEEEELTDVEDDDDDDEDYTEPTTSTNIATPETPRQKRVRMPRPVFTETQKYAHATHVSACNLFIRRGIYEELRLYLGRHSHELTSIGSIVKSLNDYYEYPSSPGDCIIVVDTMVKLLQLQCFQARPNNLTVDIIVLALRYTGGRVHEIQSLLIDYLVRHDVSRDKLYDMVDRSNVTIGVDGLDFAIQWLRRTKYPLWFHLQGFTAESIADETRRIKLSCVLRDAALQNRLPSLVTWHNKLHASVMDTIFRRWSDADVNMFIRHIHDNSKYTCHTRSLNPWKGLTDTAWRRAQHSMYVDYAIALGHIKTLSVYVIVWIVEKLIDDKEDVKHIKAVRLVERVVAAHKKKRVRIAQSKLNKRQIKN